jgi:hypothetical protein
MFDRYSGAASDREVHLLQIEQGGVHGDVGEARQNHARHHIHRYASRVLALRVLLLLLTSNSTLLFPLHFLASD